MPILVFVSVGGRGRTERALVAEFSPDPMDAAVHGLTELADHDQLATGAYGIDDARLGGRR